jgi:hypothetical protein
MVCCTFNGCTVKASFNLPWEKQGIFCNTHKLLNMINVVTIKCLHVGCNTHPIFNMPHKKKGIYCLTHKLPNMVNVKSRKCIHEGCDARPNYNMRSEIQGIYCRAHKLSNMINIYGIYKLCIHVGCTKQSSFNLPDTKKPLYCSTHKSLNMVSINKHHFCIHVGCTKYASFNLPNESKRLYCHDHKSIYMVNINKQRKTKKCTICKVHITSGDLCSMCVIYNLPNDKKLMKELYIYNNIVIEFGNEYFQNQNTNIYQNLLKEYKEYVLIIEIVENQSCSYHDISKITQLYSTICKPVKIIRFNCDSYEKDDKTIRGCFLFRDNKLNIYKNEYESRFNKLVENIKKYTETLPDKEMCIDYMYYDT